MGLIPSYLRLLAREHRRRPLSGTVLTLGRQQIYATLDQVRRILGEEGCMAATLPGGVPERTQAPAWRGQPEARFTSDVAAFALFGLATEALDQSAYEGADHVVDLNLPIPAELAARFDVVIDGGTLEHVFDVAQALGNIRRLLRPGGRVIHVNPANNHMAHGFYQFSPTLFVDYYGRHGFSDARGAVIEVPLDRVHRAYQGRCRHWAWDPLRPYAPMISRDPLAFWFTATSSLKPLPDVVPQQGDMSGVGAGGRTEDRRTTSRWSHRLYRALPFRLQWGLTRVLGRDLTRRPWGLQYLGLV